MSKIITSPEISPAELLPLVMQLLERDKWSRDRLLEYQAERLRALIAHAVSASPYYREVLGPDAASGDVPLDELPTLSKTTMLDNFDRIVTDERLRRACIDTHVTGPDAAQPLLGDYRIFASSGTTGERGLFVHSRDAFLTAIAVCVACPTRAGITPTTRTVAIGGGGALRITRHISEALSRMVPSQAQTGPKLTVSTPMAEMVPTLNAYQPEALVSYASVLALLAERQIRGELHIAPTTVCSGGEVLSDDMRQRIHEAWGLHTIDGYGATEAIGIASGCPEHVGMHVYEDLVILEAVDEHNRPVPPGTPSHKVLLTNLVNTAQPLIRYELPDSVTMADGPNPTGRPYQRIARVDGRSDDILTFPTPSGGTIAVSPFSLKAPFLKFPDVCQYQVLHDGTRVRLHVVLRPSAAPDTPTRIRIALLDAITNAGALPPLVEVTPVAVINREPGEAGKLKFVKSSSWSPHPTHP